MRFTSLDEVVKKRVGVVGKYWNWKSTVGKCIIVWAAFPFNFSFWMMPLGVMMVMGITPSLWGRVKLREFEQWRKCLIW